MNGVDLPSVWVTGLAFAATVAFTALALRTMLRPGVFGRWPIAAALLATAVWLLGEGLLGAQLVSSWISEAIRNLFWLWFMAAIAGQRDDARKIGAVGWIYIGLFVIEAVMAVTIAFAATSGEPLDALTHVLATMQMLFAAGALVLVHNLIDAGRVEERRTLMLPMAALTVMWAYDLNLYAISYLSGEPAQLLIDLRSMCALVVAGLIAISMMQSRGQAVSLSRPVAFRSLAVASVLGWLSILSILSVLVDGSGADFGARAQVGLLAATAAGAALLGLSPTLRAMVKVWIAKHFFEHRYDYRAEWLRFTGTLHRPEAGGLSLDARVVKAIGDIVESTGGVLITADGGHDHFAVAAEWQGDVLTIPRDAPWAEFVQWIGTSGRIVQFDEIRSRRAPAREQSAVPAGLVDDPALWIAVPLIHLDRVEGIVLLARPLLSRALDWEDFDLLKVAGRQAASHLAEARGAEALAESVRFEEFHRRFAFIMHDVKNLASQMAVLSRNVERHGDNPDFRVDMVETLRLSADRLGQLTQRLSQQERVRVDRLVAVDIGQIAARVASIKRTSHPVELVGSAPNAMADNDTFHQLLTHLVQNAIDATVDDSPVVIVLGERGGHVTVTVSDKGVGMSPEFVRSGLFRPFVSTKEGGFGIGAYQARQLAHAMGGDLTVESREGVGSHFTVTLAKAERDEISKQGEAA